MKTKERKGEYHSIKKELTTTRTKKWNKEKKSRKEGFNLSRMRTITKQHTKIKNKDKVKKK